MTANADDLRSALSHVLWIGGGTDAGKTSTAQVLAERFRLPVYHYDRADVRHHERLAQTSPKYAALLGATMDERWVKTTPRELVERSWQSFHDRFPFVAAELTTLHVSIGMHVLAEGFGLTPGLVAPLLTTRHQAIWMFPTQDFKRASMQRRRKGEFGGAVSDPERAAANLLHRDLLLAERMRTEAISLGLTVFEIDGSEPVEAIAARTAQHFGLGGET